MFLETPKRFLKDEISIWTSPFRKSSYESHAIQVRDILRASCSKTESMEMFVKRRVLGLTLFGDGLVGEITDEGDADDFALAGLEEEE